MTTKREQSSIIQPGEKVRVGGFLFYRWVDLCFAGAGGEVILFLEYNTHTMCKCVLLGLEHMIKSKYGCITEKYININITVEQAENIIRILQATMEQQDEL